MKIPRRLRRGAKFAAGHRECQSTIAPDSGHEKAPTVDRPPVLEILGPNGQNPNLLGVFHLGCGRHFLELGQLTKRRCRRLAGAAAREAQESEGGHAGGGKKSEDHWIFCVLTAIAVENSGRTVKQSAPESFIPLDRGRAEKVPYLAGAS